MFGELPQPVRGRLVILQVIVACLASGVISLGIVAFLVTRGGPIQPGANSNAASVDMIRIMGAAILIGGAVGGLMFKRVAVRTLSEPTARDTPAAGSTDTEHIFNRFFVATIIAAALLEGPAILLAINHLLSANLLDLTLAAAGVVCMVMLHFPTEGRVRSFMEAAQASRQRL